MKEPLPTFLKWTNQTNLSLISTTELSAYTLAQHLIEKSMMSTNDHHAQHGCTLYIMSIYLTSNTLVLGYNT